MLSTTTVRCSDGHHGHHNGAAPSPTLYHLEPLLLLTSSSSSSSLLASSTSQLPARGSFHTVKTSGKCDDARSSSPDIAETRSTTVITNCTTSTTVITTSHCDVSDVNKLGVANSATNTLPVGVNGSSNYFLTTAIKSPTSPHFLDVIVAPPPSSSSSSAMGVSDGPKEFKIVRGKDGSLMKQAVERSNSATSPVYSVVKDEEKLKKKKEKRKEVRNKRKKKNSAEKSRTSSASFYTLSFGFDEDDDDSDVKSSSEGGDSDEAFVWSSSSSDDGDCDDITKERIVKRIRPNSDDEVMSGNSIVHVSSIAESLRRAGGGEGREGRKMALAQLALEPWSFGDAEEEEEEAELEKEAERQAREMVEHTERGKSGDEGDNKNVKNTPLSPVPELTEPSESECDSLSSESEMDDSPLSSSLTSSSMSPLPASSPLMVLTSHLSTSTTSAILPDVSYNHSTTSTKPPRTSPQCASASPKPSTITSPLRRLGLETLEEHSVTSPKPLQTSSTSPKPSQTSSTSPKPSPSSLKFSATSPPCLSTSSQLPSTLSQHSATSSTSPVNCSPSSLLTLSPPRSTHSTAEQHSASSLPLNPCVSSSTSPPTSPSQTGDHSTSSLNKLATTISPKISPHTPQISLHSQQITKHSPHSSQISPHSFRIPSHNSQISPHTSQISPYTSQMSLHTSQMPLDTSQISPNTSQVSPHSHPRNTTADKQNFLTTQPSLTSPVLSSSLNPTSTISNPNLSCTTSFNSISTPSHPSTNSSSLIHHHIDPQRRLEELVSLSISSTTPSTTYSTFPTASTSTLLLSIAPHLSTHPTASHITSTTLHHQGEGGGKSLSGDSGFASDIPDVVGTLSPPSGDKLGGEDELSLLLGLAAGQAHYLRSQLDEADGRESLTADRLAQSSLMTDRLADRLDGEMADLRLNNLEMRMEMGRLMMREAEAWDEVRRLRDEVGRMRREMDEWRGRTHPPPAWWIPPHHEQHARSSSSSQYHHHSYPNLRSPTPVRREQFRVPNQWGAGNSDLQDVREQLGASERENEALQKKMVESVEGFQEQVEQLRSQLERARSDMGEVETLQAKINFLETAIDTSSPRDERMREMLDTCIRLVEQVTNVPTKTMRDENRGLREDNNSLREDGERLRSRIQVLEHRVAWSSYNQGYDVLAPDLRSPVQIFVQQDPSSFSHQHPHHSYNHHHQPQQQHRYSFDSPRDQHREPTSDA